MSRQLTFEGKTGRELIVEAENLKYRSICQEIRDAYRLAEAIEATDIMEHLENCIVMAKKMDRKLRENKANRGEKLDRELWEPR
jgi:hypothetical protein